MPCKPNTALGRKPSSAAGAASENSPRREPWETEAASRTKPRQGRWKGAGSIDLGARSAESRMQAAPPWRLVHREPWANAGLSKSWY
jgi:hypothetical protein